MTTGEFLFQKKIIFLTPNLKKIKKKVLTKCNKYMLERYSSEEVPPTSCSKTISCFSLLSMSPIMAYR